MKPYSNSITTDTGLLLIGDATERLRDLPDSSVNCCVTSPPYFGLRDYKVDGQIGLESTPEAFIERLVGVFREVRRVLCNDGVLWVNMGDSYAAQRGGTSMPAETLAGGVSGQGDGIAKRGRGEGSCAHRNAALLGLKHKDLIGIPWMLAFALRSDGWYLRQDIIWHKPNPMPESVTDRCTKSHEYVFMLSKSARYWYDADAIAEEANTNDLRRPYGSEGAWQLDGRPPELRHGGEPRNLKREGPNSCMHVSHAAPGSKPNPSRAAQRWPGIGPQHGKERNRGEQYKPMATHAVRNKRDVWTVATAPFSEAHFATFPPELIKPMILAGCPLGGTVLDPFMGAGTTAMVSAGLGRRWIGVELNPEYATMATNRVQGPLFAPEVLA